MAEPALRQPTLESLVEQAKAGSKEALESIVRQIQDDVYGLAIKMLWHPEDAKDATQEILIRVITHLSKFRGDSAFKTWVYRVAANYLASRRKSCAEDLSVSFEAFGEDLYNGLSDAPLPGTSTAEQNLLVDEVRLGCTQGMLLCLDRDHRIAYVLGEILGLTGEQGGVVLGMTVAAGRTPGPGKKRGRAQRERGRDQKFRRAGCPVAPQSRVCGPEGASSRCERDPGVRRVWGAGRGLG